MDVFYLVGTVVSGIISSVALVISIVISYNFNRKNEKERFDLQRQSIHQFKLKYPYFDDMNFTNTWDPKLRNDKKFLRYSVYCTIVFNYLYDIYVWKKSNKAKIEDYITIKRWVKVHEKYWKNPIVKNENIDIYGDDFFYFINSYFK